MNLDFGNVSGNRRDMPSEVSNAVATRRATLGVAALLPRRTQTCCRHCHRWAHGSRDDRAHASRGIVRQRRGRRDPLCRVRTTMRRRGRLPSRGGSEWERWSWPNAASSTAVEFPPGRVGSRLQRSPGSRRRRPWGRAALAPTP